MKRAGNLYRKIIEPDNLRLAFVKAARGKQDRGEVVRFRAFFDENLAELHRQLLARRVEVGDYRFFTVHDPKERVICAAAFRERVLHHAIMNLCEPVLEHYAIFDSYACRTGKGQRAAVARSREFAGRFAWYLKLDIRKYFDSIDQTVLQSLLARRIKDRDLLDLVARILANYEVAPGRGLPIGNLLSQHFANFYLGLLDHWLKEERGIAGYLRYMDDFVLFADDKATLQAELAAIEGFLRERLRLELKENRQLNRTACGVPFLGLRVFPHGVRLTPRSRRRFACKLREGEARALRGEWSEATLARHVTPLVEFTRAAAAEGFRRNILERFGVPF